MIPYLLEQPPRGQCRSLPLACPGWIISLPTSLDLTMFNVLTSYANFDELELGTGVPRFDAVVHFAPFPAFC
ncbi:MAG: hypothetical protein R3E89_18775 [Thiolinea sp.]